VKPAGGAERGEFPGPLIEVEIEGAFDLERTLNSGQVFHWKRRGSGWEGMMGNAPCYVEQTARGLRVDGLPPETATRYFALDHPLSEIIASFPRDAALDAAVQACPGLRVMRQPLWECVATFITSAQKAVPHIAQISHTLRQKYGKPARWAGGTLFAYPTAKAIAALREEDLRSCALGYRAKNLLKSARMVVEGEVDLEAISSMDDETAHAELCRLAGVGPKVANCALLFAYERLAAFPIDVWIERVLLTLYFRKKRKVTAKRLREFAASYFGPYGGYAQQYLFHHARSLKADAKPRNGKGQTSA
jgi:N-glycosylase/DNA lyase